MKTLHILLTCLLLNACSSNDAVDQASLLPPITTTGENTFGCLIDGKFFKPRDGRVTVNSDNKGMRIWTSEQTNVEYDARDFKSDKTSSLLIHIENFQYNNAEVYTLDASNGLRGLDGNNNSYAHCRVWINDILGYQRYVTFQNSGIIDASNLIQTGQSNLHHATFEFKLINSNNVQDTIIIKSGRFDLDSFTLDQKRWD
jgi:hypothetical protein